MSPITGLKESFDSVHLNRLFYKIHIVGIDVKTLRILKNMYSSVKKRVKACSSLSDFVECTLDYNLET